MSENRGQKTLHELGKYFDKENIKPLTDEPEKITLQSAPDNIKAVNCYFKNNAYEFEILILLLFPAFILTIFLILQRRSASIQTEIEKIPEKDFNFIEMVRLQKGLEEFDRDFLLQLSFEAGLKPAYQIFIDKNAFEKIEEDLIVNIYKCGEKVDSNKRVRYLRKLKLKLF